VSQQNVSIAQTCVQQARLSQKGVPCTAQQLPAAGSPQPLQSVLASPMQTLSHATTQQYPSMAQTRPQQDSSAQPGMPAVKQLWGLSGHGQSQSSNASPAQVESHAIRQQNESPAHTARQHVRSLQKGSAWAAQQSPAPPQGEAAIG
jgi:hypothetical protein